MDAVDVQVQAKPTVEDMCGKAWLVGVDEYRRQNGLPPEDDATVVDWIVEAPWAHPVWHSYILVLVHLRPIENPQPTNFYLPGATHEMWLYALDSKADRDGIIAGRKSPAESILQPMNFGAQMIEASDETAAERVRQSVLAIVQGRLSPDTDNIWQWVQLYGDNMLARKFQ